jgi:uncharacterized protein (DUF2141 family)
MRVISFFCVMALAGIAQAADLTVTITAPAPTGEVRAMLFKDATSFDHRQDPVAAIALAPHDGKISTTISGLPPGIYAVAAFQDLNGNERLDTNLFGAPTEPYGFSNDAAGAMGPPGFDKAAVTVGDSDLAITVHLRR